MLSFGGAKHDVWLSAILATLLGLAGSYLIITLALSYPSQTIIEYSQQILGKWLGKLVSLIYISFFVLSTGYVTRDFSELYLNFVMPQVSIYVFVGIILLAAAYALVNGLHIIGRIAEILVPFIFLVILLGIFGNIPNMYLMPSLALEAGWWSITADAITEWPFFGMGVFWLFLFPSLETKTGTLKTILISIIIVGITMLIVAMTVVAVIGPFNPPLVNYQFFNVFQQIKLGNYIQRLDLLLLIGWTSTSFIAITMFFYTAVTATKQLLGLKSTRYLILPFAIVILAISVYGFSSYMHLRNFFRLDHIGLIAIPIEFGIPLVLLVVGYMKSKIPSRTLTGN